MPLGARTGSSFEAARWFSEPGRSLEGTDTRPGTARPKWLAVAGGPGRAGVTGPTEDMEPAEVMAPTEDMELAEGMGPTEGMGPATGKGPAAGRGPGGWNVGALNGDGASGGGTGAGAEQVEPTDCKEGTRGWVRAAQVTNASEQKEETWGRKTEYIRIQDIVLHGGGEKGPPASKTKEADSSLVNNYLKVVFSLAKGESLQGTGKRRRASRGRCQQ